MLYNTKTLFCDLTGNPTTSKGKPLTILNLIAEILLLSDEKTSSDAKLKQYKLAELITTNDESVEISMEDVAVIIEVCKKFAGVLALGRILEFLENGEPSKKSSKRITE